MAEEPEYNREDYAWVRVSDRKMVYKKVRNVAEERRSNLHISVEPDCEIVSDSLPENYPFHTGKFSPDGQPVFANWAEHDDCIRRAQAHGENVGYLGRGRREILPPGT